MDQKKILVLGAAGTMGGHLVPKLAECGYHVDAVFLGIAPYDHPNINKIVADGKDPALRKTLLQNKYDAIIDFLYYYTADLMLYIPQLIENTGHYIFLSSYRVYDDSPTPITENSSRLLDTSKDVFLVNSDDYSIQKARGENIVRNFQKKNWTIVRPAITYSLMRYPLVTMQSMATVVRAKLGKTVVLPETARDVQATLSWGGDVAEMIARLVFNEKAFGETYTVSTAEHHPWGEVVQYYQDACDMKVLWLEQTDYLRAVYKDYEEHPYTNSWQLWYDRLFNRVIDNSKILADTGMKQCELMKLADGLKYEISRCPEYFIRDLADHPVNQNIDAFLQSRGLA